MRKFLLLVLICVATTHGMELSTAKSRKSKISRLPSLLKHYDVPVNQSKNKFLLKLDQSDPSASIDYLWDGKSVARYIVANQKMFLESLNPEGYNFSILTPIKTGDLNINLYGKLKFQELVVVGGIADIQCKSLKNNNTFSAQQLYFDGQSVVNNGSINTGRCVIEKSDTVINKNSWVVEENCYLKNIKKLLTSKNSSWRVRGSWNGMFNNLDLDGDLSIGVAAFFSVSSGGFFKGLINVPILKGESKGTFESSPNSKFLINYHLSLKAKESINWEGSIFDKLGNKLPFQKDDLSKLDQMYKKGVYLQSDEGNLHKSGIIDVADKPVFLAAKKDLHHDQQTKTKETEDGVIVLSGTSIDLGKQSELEAYAAQLQAQESIIYNGKALIEPRAQVHNASQDAIVSAGAIALEAKKINFNIGSRIDARRAYIRAQDAIDQQGILKIKEDLTETASTIEMKRNSFIRARNAFVHGAKKLSQYGKLITRQALMMRANQLYNDGIIKAENSHFKADRWLLNRGIINTDEMSQIDALLSMNICPGTIGAKILKTNALGNLNLGICNTQMVDSNTILNFNMGEYLLPLNHVFPGNFERTITPDKVRAVAEQSLLLMAPPNIQAYYRLGKFWLNLGFTFDAVGRLYKEWNGLPLTYTGASDLMPLLAGSFNFAFSSFQQVRSTNNLLNTISGLYKEDNGINLVGGMGSSGSTLFDSMKALQSIAASILPSHHFKSIVNINFGTMQGIEGNFTNIFDFNAGESLVKDVLWDSAGLSFGNKALFPGGLLFLNNYALNTYRGFHDGMLGAPGVIVNAKLNYSTGENSSMGSLDTSLEARDLTLKNHVYAVAASLKALGALSLHGNISALHKISLMAPEIVLKKNSCVSVLQGGIFANGKRIENAGNVNGQQVCVFGKDVVLKDGSNTQSHGSQAAVAILAEDFKAEGGSNIVASGDGISDKSNNKIMISAKNADLQKGSNFDACNGSLQVVAAENITHEAAAKAQRVHMKAQNILLKEGSDTQVHERDPVLELPKGGSREVKKGAQEGQALVTMQAEDILKAEKGAQVIVSGVGIQVQDSLTSQDTDSKIILHGGKKIDLQQGSHFDPLDGSTMITGGDATIAASMKGVVLARTKNLVIEENSGIDSNRIRAVAEEKIVQKGNLKAPDFFMRAKYIENYGKINGKKGVMKADRWYWNTGGVISDDSLDIIAPVSVNWTSHTKAKRLTTNALLDINLLSIDETQILDNKSLLSLDFSLHLPLITDDMISDDSIKDASTRALLLVAPPQVKLLYKLASFLARIPGMVSDANALVNDMYTLYKDPNATASDWVPLINRAASLVLAAKQGCGMAKEMYAEFAPASGKADEKQLTEGDRAENTDSCAQNSDEDKSSDKTDEKVPLISHTSKGTVITLKTFENVKEARDAITSIGGALINQHHNRQSLADLNYGAAVGFNGSSVNLWDKNGAKLYANYHLDTCYGQNLGILAGGNVSISANKYQNGISSNVGGKQIESSACIAGLNLAIKADSFKGSTNSHIVTTNGASLETKELDNKGTTQGSLNLKFTGQPEQLKSIGIVKANGGSFSYQGPIAEHDGTGMPSADELARGSGVWGSVSGASVIRFDAGVQDLHIKQPHFMPHALHAKTAGNIDVDQLLKSQHSISLHAGQNLNHNSLIAKEHIQRIAEKGNITAGSTVERAHDGANYEDRVNQCSVIAGKSNTAYAGNNIIQTAVETKSGKEGTRFMAQGYIIDESLTCEKHTEKQSATESCSDTHIIPQGSTHASDGYMDIKAGEKYMGQATKFDAKGGVRGLKGTEITDAKEIHIHESTKKSDGWWSSEVTEEKTITSKSVGPEFMGHGTPFEIGSDKGETVLVNPCSDVPLVLKGESAQIRLGQKQTIYVKEGDYDNWVRTKNNVQQKKEIIYVPLQVPGIENHAQSLLIESSKGNPAGFLSKIDNKSKGKISQSLVEEYHHDQEHTERHVKTGAKLAIGLTIGLATQGLAAPVAAGFASMGAGATVANVIAPMTVGAVNYGLGKAVNTLIETGGDLEKTAALMASTQTLKEAAFAAMSAGVTSGADRAMNVLGLPYAQEGGNFLERVAYAAPREFIHMGVKTGISTLAGLPINQVLPEQLKDFATKTLHNALVGEIAYFYAAEDINSLAHKVLHGVAAGSIYGGIHGSMSTALAAGLGAFSAEIAAELMAPSKDLMNVIMKADSYGYRLTQEQFITSYADAMRDYMKRTHTAQQVGQLTAAITALAMGQDASIAHQAALTALDNNFLVLAMYGITAASTAYSGYKIYKSYQEEGVAGALKQLGIEVTYVATGHAAGRVIARVGTMAYPCVKDAVVTVLDEAPALKLLLGDMAQQLIIAAEKLNESAVGKVVSKIESTLVENEAKVLSKLGFNGRIPAAAGVVQEDFAATEEMVLAGTGIKVRVEREAQKEVAVFRNTNNKRSAQTIKDAGMVSTQQLREQILPKVKTYEQARNKALEIIGEVDVHTGKPYRGKFDIFNEKIVGREWHNEKVVIRLDWDPKKGPHINVTDFRLGKGTKGTVVAIPFEGTLETAAAILKHLNK